MVPPATMVGYTPPAVQAAPPVPCRLAMAAGSVFGSGGKAEDTGATGGSATPAAHGLGLIAAPPADRKALVPLVPHAGVTCPESSEPSAQIALVEPALAPAAHRPPPPTQACPSA